MIHWFGETFNPFCTPETKVPVPVGRKCESCEEPIDADQSGVVLPDLDFKAGTCSYLIYHCECLFRHLVGSAGHLRKQCSCYGQEDTSELGLSAREAALEAWAYFHAHKVTVH